MSDGLWSPGNAAMLACGWLGEIVNFLPPRQRILPVFFVRIPFVSFYKIANSVTHQIRNCPRKTQTATTGTRSPLLASQYNLIGRRRCSAVSRKTASILADIQLTLVISKSKGPSEKLRDIHTSTYQMCSIEKNTNRTTKFHK